MRVVVITGGSGRGIGFETAVSLCSLGARCILVCRSDARAQAAVSQIQERVGTDARVEYVCADLADLTSVRHAVRAIEKRTARLDVLVHNAGIMYFGADEYVQVAPGIKVEKAMAVNHVGTMLINELLTPLLMRTGTKDEPARIVHVSSEAHRRGSSLDAHGCMLGHHGHKYANPMKRWPLNGYWRYGDSKLCQLMCAIAFQEALPKDAAQRVRTVCVHPGLVHTELFANIRVMQPILRWFPWLYLSPRRAAAYIVDACSSQFERTIPRTRSAGLDGWNGWTYMNKDKVSQVARCARDRVRRNELLKASQSLVQNICAQK